MRSRPPTTSGRHVGKLGVGSSYGPLGGVPPEQRDARLRPDAESAPGAVAVPCLGRAEPTSLRDACRRAGEQAAGGRVLPADRPPAAVAASGAISSTICVILRQDKQKNEL